MEMLASTQRQLKSLSSTKQNESKEENRAGTPSNDNKGFEVRNQCKVYIACRLIQNICTCLLFFIYTYLND